MTDDLHLDGLPRPGEKNLAVRVSPDALRQVRGGHPWIFDGAVRSISHDGAAGDLAVVFDDQRRFAAIGLYDPDSPIRVRVLHVGDPIPIDADFWTGRLVNALDRRQALADDPGTDAYRCVHGENDGFPGLVVDRYADTIVVKIYTTAWYPHLADLVPPLAELTDARRVVLRHGRSVAAEATSLVGDLPSGPVEFTERGLRFGADVVAGQKTGHFLDQRENRVLVGQLAEGARVLDVFCCTGGFSVHAAAGGAASVDSVDSNEPALATARANMARNTDLDAVIACRHRTIAGDAFAVLEDLAGKGRRYDVVVIDPPSFASREAQVSRALASHARLTTLGLRVVAPGGLLVQSSCSSRVDEHRFHDTVRSAAHDGGHRLVEWLRTSHAIDHPVGFPEGRYLETVFARVDP